MPSNYLPDTVVLIPSYNRPEHLTRCLQALEKYTPTKEFDLLIVDDCSPMEIELGEIIRPYMARHLNWRHIKTPQNGGFTKCVNWGIQYIQNKMHDYRYMLLLNNDATVGPGWLKEMKDAFDDPLPVGIVAPFMGVWCPDSIYATPVGEQKPYRPDLPPIQARTQMVNDLGCTEWYEDHVGFWGVMIRMDLFKMYGNFDERFEILCQDLDWCFRITKYGWKIKVTQKVPGQSIIWHQGHTHIDLKPRDYIDENSARDQRLIREIWPEKWS